MRTVALATCILVIGCSKDPTPDLEALAGRACACGSQTAPAFGTAAWTSGGASESLGKSRTCANQVLADFTKLVESNPSANADEDSDVSAFLAARRMSSCLLGAGAELKALQNVKASGRVVLRRRNP